MEDKGKKLGIYFSGNGGVTKFVERKKRKQYLSQVNSGQVYRRLSTDD